MKHSILKSSLMAMASSLLIVSCSKDVEVGILNDTPGYYSDNTMALKEAADFPIGVAISYSPMINDNAYSAVVKRDFDAVTFDYNMKHGAIVQSDGTYNFANADAMVNAAGTMDVFGHTLLWHQNQNADYLESFAGITLPATVELAANPGFENGLTGWSTFNSGNPAGSATIAPTTVASEVRTGTGAMKVANPTAYPGSQWRVQVSSSAIATNAGTQYKISYWVKAAAAGGSIRLSTGPSAAQYQGDQTIGTAWQEVSWTITASLASTTFLFDMGQAANTYYIDDVSVKEIVAAPSGPQIAVKVDQALNDWITATVNHYKTKVHAWDVANEVYADNPVAIRTNANTTNTAADAFVWTDYLGRDGVLKAFNYAKAADPTADLYINDYNLESNPAKLDSVIALVAELKAKGAKVDGIGTQMHLSTNVTGFAGGVDDMFRKLAATGLKIRVSELDVTTSASGTKLLKAIEVDQPAIYKYVVASYIKYVPAAQRAGITIWGVADINSWRYNSGAELPLLYDNDFNKKPAYAAFLDGLK
jgi:endo-1,4-beta-xylanase